MTRRRAWNVFVIAVVVGIFILVVTACLPAERTSCYTPWIDDNPMVSTTTPLLPVPTP